MAYYEGDPNNQQGQDTNQGTNPETNGQQFQGQQDQQFQGQPGQNQQFQGQQPYQQQPYQQQQYQTYNGYQAYDNYVDTGHSPTQIMVFGIISLAGGTLFGWTFLFGILAIVFGALAMSWGKKFMNANPNAYNPQVKAGRICGIIGMILGIVTMSIMLIIVIAGGCAAIMTRY